MCSLIECSALNSLSFSNRTFKGPVTTALCKAAFNVFVEKCCSRCFFFQFYLLCCVLDQLLMCLHWFQGTSACTYGSISFSFAKVLCFDWIFASGVSHMRNLFQRVLITLLECFATLFCSIYLTFILSITWAT